jgi:hypothetical protein
LRFDRLFLLCAQDPNAPPGALSAYMFFSKENRHRIKQANPDVSFGGLGKLLGAEWKQISIEDKRPYQRQAEEDKKRHEKDLIIYVRSFTKQASSQFDEHMFRL